MKIDKFREDGYGNILKYCQTARAYLFYCKGSSKTLKRLEKEEGKYVD